VIILAEKKTDPQQETEGVGIVSVNGFDFLAEDPNALFARTPGINGETVAGKWTKAVLERDELALIQSLINHASVHQFNDIATVDVGIVTGANEFFSWIIRPLSSINWRLCPSDVWPQPALSGDFVRCKPACGKPA
jgi:hypothetical protein